MKRLLSFVLALSMMFCFASCGEDEVQAPAEKAPEKTVEQIKEARDATTGTDDKKLNDAVSAAVFAYNKDLYKQGEVVGEGHKIIAQKEVDGKLYVYAYMRYGVFEMKDGAMCKIDGFGAIPALFIFDKDYNFIEVKEPDYSSEEAYNASKDEVIASDVADLFAAFNEDPMGYVDLTVQEASYVEIYLKENGIDAVIKQ